MIVLIYLIAYFSLTILVYFNALLKKYLIIFKIMRYAFMNQEFNPIFQIKLRLLFKYSRLQNSGLRLYNDICIVPSNNDILKVKIYQIVFKSLSFKTAN